MRAFRGMIYVYQNDERMSIFHERPIFHKARFSRPGFFTLI